MLTLTWIFRSLGAAQTVLEGRKATEAIFRGSDDRLIVVVGYVIFFFTELFHS
jgi:3-deoxy-D-arabino-heptulosonate 7-phosphate (DAHP) synthase